MAIIQSIIDDDLYKLSMQAAIMALYPRNKVRYRLFLRDDVEFPDGFAAALREEVNAIAKLALTDDEKHFLSLSCPYFPPPYLDFLHGYRHDPNEVKISQSDGKLSVEIEGYWYRTVLWEVKLMALISELYFDLIGGDIKMTRNCIDGPGFWKERAEDKGTIIYDNQLRTAEFGSRRRRSFRCQDIVVENLKKMSGEYLIGTSNVYLAMKHGLKAIGTQAHEWYMFHAAKYGVLMANSMGMGKWVDFYHGSLGIALPDTFTTQEFLRVFDGFYAKLFDGTRQDSGDPYGYGETMVKHYEGLGIDPITKSVVFSDGLTLTEAIQIKNVFHDQVKDSYGIGTHFSNDVGVVPLNMVIKMVGIHTNGVWVPTCKLSDTPGKHTGDEDTIKLYKEEIRRMNGVAT